MTIPVVNSVTPKFGANDADVSVTILGTGFDVTPTVFLIGDEMTEPIPLTGITRPDANTINATVPSNVFPDRYNILVINPGLEQGTLVDAYSVIFPLPALPFTSETQSAILARMVDDIDEVWDVAPGSFPHMILSAFAYELAKMYIRQNDTILNFWPQYARAGFLSLAGESAGLIRRSAQKAVGTVTITGTPATAIPLGTQMSTTVVFGQGDRAVVFETTVAAVIAGSGAVDIPVQALVAGEAGNVPQNTVSRLMSPIAAVSGLNNGNPTAGGSVEESDDSFRVRLLDYLRHPPGGGNRQDYVRWALEVPGVGDAHCAPLVRGLGTVDVIILGVDLLAPLPALITSVQNYIAPGLPGEGNGKAPIGADVLVRAPTFQTASIAVTIVLEQGFDLAEVRSAVSLALTTYLQYLPMGTDVLVSNIANIVHDTPGVYNYSGILVQGNAFDLEVGEVVKVTPGTITVT